MKRRMTNNPFGSRKMPAAALPTVPFEIPAADRDETAPTGRIIRAPLQRRQSRAEITIEIIRKITLEVRNGR